MNDPFDFWDRSPENFDRRLEFIVETMRELSRITDPQATVQTYMSRMRRILPTDGVLSLSRRDLEQPCYRITRSHLHRPDINPWTMQDQLPVFRGGLLAELIYADEPRIIDELHVDASDPAGEYLKGQKSLCAVPLFDQGAALNMVVLLRKQPRGFQRDRLAEQVWMSNLFGRATQNQVLSTQLKRAYDEINAEMKIVQDIQRSLLPRELPDIPTLDLAAHYQTSRHAGGDYYDFFPFADGRWGMLIADVSGHGTPAAVLMAITHSIVHAHDAPAAPPSRLLSFVNRRLSSRYTAGSGNFVTAFYGIYNPTDGSVVYCSAGHCAPRIKRCSTGELLALDQSQSLPLGIDADAEYHDCPARLVPGDFAVFYTDGITEARKTGAGELFGIERLDQIVATCPASAAALIDSLLQAVANFTDNAPPSDDRTIVVGRVR